MRLPSLVLLGLLASCGASLSERAGEAMKRGDYRKAAELYDELVAKNPKDQVALQKRTEARHGVLRQIFQANQVARSKNDRALAIRHLGNLLQQRDDWAMEIEPRFANALAAEVGMAGNDIAIDVDHKTNTVGPLASEHLLVSHAELLGHRDFGGRGDAIYMKVRDVGRGACSTHAADVTRPGTTATPYWRWLVDRYCAHWGERDRVGAVELPNLHSGFYVVGEVDGQTAGETDALESALTQAFRASAWYSPTAPNAVHTKLTGRVAIGFTQRSLTQHTTYDEEVPYTDYETRQESYQEPYDDTESYTEQVPYTETESRPEVCEECSPTGTCQRQTCAKTETVTKYRTEYKTRTVTRYRTAWRTVTEPVTKYRTVTHPYSYDATEVTGSYATQLAVRVVEPATPEVVGVVASTAHAQTLSGIDHDVTFAPAGVYPSRANLPSREAVLAQQRRALQERLVAVLDERYARLYCTRATYDREAAAACAYLDHAKAPAAVHATLRSVFGADEPFLGPVFSRELEIAPQTANRK